MMLATLPTCSRRTTKRLAVGVLVLLGLSVHAVAGAGAIRVWPVDPHAKIFRDTSAGTAGPVALRAARNEYEPAQIAFRADAELKAVRVELSPLVHADGRATIAGANVSWRFVGYVPLAHNTPGADAIRLRAAPCEIPDPLLEDRTLDVPAGRTQAVWITVRVPNDAVPGAYRGQVSVIAADARTALPLELTVDAFTLPDERHLLVTNWFTVDAIARRHNAALWSEPFWAVLERYARNMAAHRQNVAYTPWSLVDVVREADGKLTFDYRRFDRYVELFQRAGAADRIELSHVGHFGPGGWGGSEIVLTRVGATDRRTGKQVSLGGEEGVVPLLAGLQRHLAERGWLDRAMVHVADEPSINNIESWHKAAEVVHRAAPGLRRIDAIETIDFSGALEVWVPKLSHFDRWREAYEARRADGEFWYYICCHPFGSRYPNRFLDLPLSRVRVLHWINFAADLKGYLHWGLNFWPADPFAAPAKNLPPGDTHTIYPGGNGPMDSLRWEIQRESLEDFEYLHLLTAKTAQLKKRLGKPAAWVHENRRAMELCREIVPAIADTERDPARILAVRRQVAEEILALDQPPLLLTETEPPAGATLVSGPIVVEVRGLSAPGAAVKVNGAPVAVGKDGRFVRCAYPRGTKHEVVIEASLGDNKKTVVRRFVVRNAE